MDAAARAALLQTSETLKPRTARKNWQVVRHSDMVTKALASQSWTVVVKAAVVVVVDHDDVSDEGQ